jgi:hypothetical protein
MTVLMTSQTEKTDPDEKRHTLRQSAVMQARIVMPNQRAFAPCLVRDVSLTGAKLIIDESWIIPRAFWLRYDGDPVLRYYIVAWRTASEVGIELATDARQHRWTRD